MAQFDVFRSPKSPRFPFLVDIQADFLARLTTRVVIPLTPLASFGARPITRLHPVVRIEDADHVLITNELAAVLASSLRARIGSIAQHRTTVIQALDLLLTGS